MCSYRLKFVDVNYKSYFHGEVYEEDGEGQGNSKTRKKSDRVLGAPNQEDWEQARYLLFYYSNSKIKVIVFCLI